MNENQIPQYDLDETQTKVEEPSSKQKNKKNGLAYSLLIFLSILIIAATSVTVLAGDQIYSQICRIDNEIINSVSGCEIENEIIADGGNQNNAVSPTQNQQPNTNSAITSELIVNQNPVQDVSNIYLSASPSVVGVGVVTGFSEEDVIGTGFVISEDGLIATNQHVVSEVGAEYFVKFNDRDDFVPVTEVFRDQVNDIAILRINETGLTPLPISNDEIVPGQPVVAIGNPLGELQSTITAGIVSGINRTVEVNAGGSFLRTSVNTFEDTIQTDAAINPGNSGGPLLNIRGEVIGINFATTPGYDNLSFALPISYLTTRLEELNQFGRFRIPYLGIEYRIRTFVLDNSIITGAQILGLDPNGTANEILEEGDVLIEFNGTQLSDESLLFLIQRSEIGETIDITFIRDTEILSGEMVIGEREE